MSELLHLLIVLIIFGVIFSLIFWVLGQIAFPAPLAWLKWAILLVLAIFAIIYLLGLLPGGGGLRHLGMICLLS